MRQLANLRKGFLGFLNHFPEIIRLLAKLPKQLWLLFQYICRYGLRCLKPRPKCEDEIKVPPEVRKRADPMLYSQEWLMSMGLSVTWDNPDIQLYLAGVPVSSDSLRENTAYEVRVRVWNNSYDAPAPGLPVHLTYFGFGAGPTGTYVGKRIIDLGAKGTTQCPAFASFIWRTPNTEGHYCLQARLVWADDANPGNNMGQENTNVGVVHSPAVFEFKVRNNAAVPRRFIFEVDDYRLPELDPCGQETVGRQPLTRLEESRARWDKALATQGYGKFTGWTSEWEVRIEPEIAPLDAGEEKTIKVSVEPKRPDFRGRKAFNVQVFAGALHQNAHRQFIGGVTLYAER